MSDTLTFLKNVKTNFVEDIDHVESYTEAVLHFFIRTSKF